MPVELEPAELARLVDFAERPRQDDWSLRAALVYYAQGQPERVARVIELVRRIESALRTHRKLLEREGVELWGSFQSGQTPPAGAGAAVVGVLRAAAELDRFADTLVAWVLDRSGPRPDAEADAVVLDVAQRLDQLGVPREERQRPTGRRG